MPQTEIMVAFLGLRVLAHTLAVEVEVLILLHHNL
jgi:hypothetical protein